MSIVPNVPNVIAGAGARRRSAPPLLPAAGRVDVVDGHTPCVGRLPRLLRIPRLRTIVLILAIAGSLIPGVGAPVIPGGSTVVRSVVTTSAIPVGPALSYRQMGDCPGGGGPCP